MNVFKLSSQENNWHQHFKVLMKDSAKPMQDVINSWAVDFVDRDNNFVQNFQKQFNPQFWELYLYKAFKELNMEVDFTKVSPDFTVKTEKNEILNIEASSANDLTPYGLELLIDSLNKPINEILDCAAIKLLGRIKAKQEEHYNQKEHVKGNPLILAIAPFEQPAFFRQNNQAINRVLYACDSPELNGMENNGQISFKNRHVTNVTKNNGTSLELGVFTTDKFKEFSAVIFSTTATFSKVIVQSNIQNCIVQSRRYKCGDGWFGYLDQLSEKRVYKETHLDGLHVYYNPYAEISLNRKIFGSHEITHNFYDIESKSMISEHNDGSLISRSTYWSYDK